MQKPKFFVRTYVSTSTIDAFIEADSLEDFFEKLAASNVDFGNVTPYIVAADKSDIVFKDLIVRVESLITRRQGYVPKACFNQHLGDFKRLQAPQATLDEFTGLAARYRVDDPLEHHPTPTATVPRFEPALA